MYKLLVMICIERDKNIVKIVFDHTNTLKSFKKLIASIKNILDNENKIIQDLLDNGKIDIIKQKLSSILKEKEINNYQLIMI